MMKSSEDNVAMKLELLQNVRNSAVQMHPFKTTLKNQEVKYKKGSDALLTTDEKSVGDCPILSWNEEAASDCRCWKQG